MKNKHLLFIPLIAVALFAIIPTKAQDSTPLLYIATLTQSGTNPPVAQVKYNTIGAIDWQRDSAGHYQAVLAGAFPTGQTWARGTTFIERFDEQTVIAEFDLNASDLDTLRFSVQTGHSEGIPAVGVEDVMIETPIEIRVYPAP